MELHHWDKEKEFGNELIDNQHQFIFDILETLNYYKETGCSTKVFESLLKVLMVFSFMHFEDEERLFFEKQCPVEMIDEHTEQHNLLLHLTRDAIENIVESHQAKDIIDNLRGLWVIHLNYEDEPFIKYFK